MLTATTRPRSTASAASSTFLVPPMFTASKSARFWLAPPSSAAQWMAESAPRAARTTASASVTSPVTTSTPSAASGAVSAVSRASARTASPRSIRSLQMLAPASPVAPVTRTVWVMPRRAPRARGMARVDLVGAVGDDRLARAEHVERVDEAVQAHGVRTGEPELDDLRRREVLAELPVELVVDGVVVGREQVEELHGQPLLLGQVAAYPGRSGRPRPRR